MHRAILAAMDTNPPVMVPGAVLAAERDTYGVTRIELARRLGLHRNTLRDWENAPEVDVIRQRRYRKALTEIAAEAVS